MGPIALIGLGALGLVALKEIRAKQSADSGGGSLTGDLGPANAGDGSDSPLTSPTDDDTRMIEGVEDGSGGVSDGSEENDATSGGAGQSQPAGPAIGGMQPGPGSYDPVHPSTSQSVLTRQITLHQYAIGTDSAVGNQMGAAASTEAGHKIGALW